MAKYDYGGGCPCGLFYECEIGCTSYRSPNPITSFDAKYIKTKGKSMTKEIEDFGFSFHDNEDMSPIIEEKTVKIEKLRGMIIPFLEKLNKNPEKDVIKWTGASRVKEVNKFIAKINSLVDG